MQQAVAQGVGFGVGECGLVVQAVQPQGGDRLFVGPPNPAARHPRLACPRADPAQHVGDRADVLHGDVLAVQRRCDAPAVVGAREASNTRPLPVNWRSRHRLAHLPTSMQNKAKVSHYARQVVTESETDLLLE